MEKQEKQTLELSLYIEKKGKKKLLIKIEGIETLDELVEITKALVKDLKRLQK